MIDPTARLARRARERRRGVFVLFGALGLALLIVGLRLATGGDDDRELAQAPTTAPLPTPPATQPPATPAPTVATPPPAPAAAGLLQPDGRNVVCLDPGHGGSDRGNVRLDEDGQILVQEKDLTLAHGLALGERLRARGIEVVFTRTTDTEVNPDNLDVNADGVVAPPGGEATSDEADDLQARINVCNAAGADLLVSIHYNSAENEFLEGYEVWYNDQRPFSDRSLAFASRIHELLGARMVAGGYDALDHGLGSEDFFVLGPGQDGERVPSLMPGAIIEGLYLSNEEDAAFVVTDAAQEAIVSAYEQAIVDYFAEYPG